MDRPSLRKALDSVLAQSYLSIEIVLVASSKGTHSSLADFEKKSSVKIKLISPEPEGRKRSAAANSGLEMASGKFALFLDDDDWIEPEHIRGLIDHFKSPEGFSAVACYSGTRCVDEIGNPLEESFGEPFDPIRLLVGNFIPIHACLFRLSAQTRLCRFDETLDLYEDWDYWMQLSTLGAFIYCEPKTAVYRLSEAGGFGVNGWDSPRAKAAHRQVLSKWRERWSSKEVELIIERARMSYLAPHEEGLPLTGDNCCSRILSMGDDGKGKAVFNRCKRLLKKSWLRLRSSHSRRQINS